MWSQSGSATIVEAAVFAGWEIILIDNEQGIAGEGISFRGASL